MPKEAMSPLRNKLNHALNKLNDKVKRHSGRSGNSNNNNDGPAQGKQLRTLPVNITLPQPPPQTQTQPQPQLQLSSAPSQRFGMSDTLGLTKDTAYDILYPISDSPTPFNPYGQPSAGYSQSASSTQPTAVNPGSVANPIDLTGNSKSLSKAGPGQSSNFIDLSSPSPKTKTTPHGQKRYWAEPSPLDPSDMDYAVGQKNKMYRATSNPYTDVATSYHRTMNPTVQSAFGSPNFEFEDQIVVATQTRRSGLPTESHSRSTLYQTEDDLADFGQQILASACGVCRMHIFSGVEDIVARTKDMVAHNRPLLHFQTCPQCKTVSCVACGSRPTPLKNNLQYNVSGTKPWLNARWCCDRGRLFVLYSLCCGPEYTKLDTSASTGPLSGMGRLKGKLKGQKPDIPAASSATSGKAREPPPRALSKGVGYGSEEGLYPLMAPVGRQLEALLSTEGNLPTTEEKLVAAYFAALRDLLSAFGDDDCQQLTTTGMSELPAMVKFMLRRSPLLPRAVEFLRIDSIEAMSVRREIYKPLLEFVTAIGRNPTTSAVVYSNLIIYPPEEQLGHFSSSRNNAHTALTNSTRPNTRSNGKGKQPELEQGSSIVKVIENLARQCQHLKQVASAHLNELQGGESSQMLDLSRTICDLAAEHAANASLAMEFNNSDLIDLTGSPPVAASSVLTRSRDTEKAREEFKELHRNSCVTDMPDAEILRAYRFQNEARGVPTTHTAKGRMKKLVAQIANLRTSLPEGIWVRHGSSRLDILKVLMVGPKGTPYENGLFEFDLFCPAQFPQVAPQMFFRTTGGGRVRFNPNLYDDGKVCLSLLGTWSGESWNPNYSTLLQVLVSIYGMILVEQPWYNEPGREQRQDKKASQNYNTKIQAHTVQVAITDWLTNRLVPPPPPPPPSFSRTTNTGSGMAAASGSRQGANTGYLRSSSSIISPWSHLPMKPAPPSVGGGPGPLAQDDPVWGEVVRKHFAANGKTIWETASKKWKVPKDDLGKLHEALSRHGFL